MHFDALTLAAIVDELSDTLVNGRVQQVIAPDEQSIGLEVYSQQSRRYLLLSADPQFSRVHLASHKLRRGAAQPSPLLQLLRKYVRGATITAIEQPLPSERVVQLYLEHPEHGPTVLIAEPMGRLANLILTKPDGRILDCVRRVRANDRGSRVLLPGKPYSPPPDQAKLLPLDDGDADYYVRLAAVVATPGRLWRALVAGIAGVSPTQARELAWRATGDANGSAEEANVLAVAQALQELWAPVQSGGWQLGVWKEGERVVGFSAYEAHFRSGFTPLASISLAVEIFDAGRSSNASGNLGESEEGGDAYAALRRATGRLLDSAQKRVERQLVALANDEPAPGEAEALRGQAEWLLALSSQIQPEQEALEVDLGDETLHIALDPRYSAVEQAQRMFGRAAKMERAARFIPIRHEQLKADLEFLEQLRSDLLLAENQPEIAAVEEELRKAGLLSARQHRRKVERVGKDAAHPRSYTSPEGYEILVGRNARQNEIVTFRDAHPQDWWLHARGAAGSHVVIRNQGRNVADSTLEMAAQLAAYYSKLRGERAAEVILAERRFVSRAGGGRTGQVHVRNVSTLVVTAEMPVFDG